jgi:TIR domain
VVAAPPGLGATAASGPDEHDAVRLVAAEAHGHRRRWVFIHVLGCSAALPARHAHEAGRAGEESDDPAEKCRSLYYRAVTGDGVELDFDVALSYAGEDRAYVERVATELRQRGVRVFYDEFLIAEMWGADLYAFLDDVYRRRAKFAVVFVSHHYARKAWTNHERQSAQARAFAEQNTYLLPVLLDDTELLGLRPTVGVVDARRFSPEALVDLIQRKLTPPPDAPEKRYGVPRGLDQRRELIAVRPPAWEFLLFGGVLRDGKQALEPKHRDHELRFARRSAAVLVSGDEAAAFISRRSKVLSVEISAVVGLLTSSSQEWAFGPPGTAGDPARIVHLATRLVDFYEYLLDWSAEIRAATPPDDFARVFGLVADMAVLPIAQTRDFIDRYVERLGPVPELLARGEDVDLSMRWDLQIDPATTKQVSREIKRLKRRGRW